MKNLVLKNTKCANKGYSLDRIRVTEDRVHSLKDRSIKAMESQEQK